MFIYLYENQQKVKKKKNSGQNKVDLDHDEVVVLKLLVTYENNGLILCIILSICIVKQGIHVHIVLLTAVNKIIFKTIFEM